VLLRNRAGAIAACVVVCLALIVASAVRGAEAKAALPSPGAVSLDPGRFAELSSGVVYVRGFNCRGTVIDDGTGFLVGKDVVMTARHVVDGACSVKVRASGRWITVDRWVYWVSSAKGSGAAEDLATLRLRSGAPGYIFSIRANSPRVGTTLAAIGYPLGNAQLSITQGPIIAKGRHSGVPYLAVRLLGAEGGSGSPLVDNAGNVDGILQQGLGSADVLKQRTSGVVLGIDLGAWWAGKAIKSLCRADPAGGIPDCPSSPPRPPPPVGRCTVKAYANCTGTSHPGLNMPGANLTHIIFNNADLNGAVLTDANLTSATMVNVNLSNADLSGADLSGANLEAATMTSANLSGANLTGADLKGGDLTNADLTATIFCETVMLDGTVNSVSC
jgi:Trypsin-like peptidase domain/Pentapeptide repeats (8 copies)